MIAQKLEIAYSRFDNLEQLNSEDKQLVDMALVAAAKAYAPYSGFHVGAALRLVDGQIVLGNNQENAAYPSGLCAERVALFAAGSNMPGIAVHTLVVIAQFPGHELKSLATPCGSCRQVMAETRLRQKDPIRVILVHEKGFGLLFDDIDALLPFIFELENVSAK